MENKTAEQVFKYCFPHLPMKIEFDYNTNRLNYYDCLKFAKEYADQQSDHDKQTIIGLKLQLQARESKLKTLEDGIKKALLPENIECDGSICQGCYKDILQSLLK